MSRTPRDVWSRREDKELERLFLLGLSDKAASKRMHGTRSPEAVRARRTTLGLMRYRRHGRSGPKTTGGRINMTISCPRSWMEEVDRIARAESMTRTRYIMNLVRQDMDRRERTTL